MFENQFETEVTEFEFNTYHRMPSKNHGMLQTRIAGLIDAKYRKEYSALSAVNLDLTSGKAIPDVAIYPKLSFVWDDDVIQMTTPPLIAIEILSPKQAVTDLTDKNNQIYFPAGVKSVWIIIPSLETIYIIPNKGKKKIYTEGVFKDPSTGIELSIEDIFAV